MFENSIFLLDWLGIIAFTTTGALVAARNQMDPVGFVLLGTVTGIGGGRTPSDSHCSLWSVPNARPATERRHWWRSS